MEKFSWKRVGMLWSYMYPAVKSQMIWFPVLSTAAALFAVLVLSVSEKLFLVASLPVTLLSFLAYLAPISIVRRDYHLTTAMLPVTAGEKLAVLVLYFVVAVPLLINVPYYLICALVWLFSPSLFTTLVSLISEELGDINYLWLALSTYPITFALVGIVLLSVVGTRRPTVSRTVVYFLVTYFVFIVIVGMLSVAVSVFEVFVAFHDGLLGADTDPEAISNYLVSRTIPMVSGMLLFVGVTAMIVVYRKIYKKLKIGGF